MADDRVDATRRVFAPATRRASAPPPAPPSAPAPAPDDGALLVALRSGDEHAFVGLVERTHGVLVRTAMAFVGDRDVAQEVVQESWIAVLKGLDRFEGRSSLRTWIVRIVANQARTRAARERRSVPFSELDPGPDEPAVEPGRFRDAGEPWPGHWAEPPSSFGPDASTRILRRETREVIVATLRMLPASQRVVMSLRDVQGWTADEVCEALEISSGNQRVLLHRARSRVRRALEIYFAGERSA